MLDLLHHLLSLLLNLVKEAGSNLLELLTSENLLNDVWLSLFSLRLKLLHRILDALLHLVHLWHHLGIHGGWHLWVLWLILHLLLLLVLGRWHHVLLVLLRHELCLRLVLRLWLLLKAVHLHVGRLHAVRLRSLRLANRAGSEVVEWLWEGLSELVVLVHHRRTAHVWRTKKSEVK